MDGVLTPQRVAPYAFKHRCVVVSPHAYRTSTCNDHRLNRSARWSWPCWNPHPCGIPQAALSRQDGVKRYDAHKRTPARRAGSGAVVIRVRANLNMGLSLQEARNSQACLADTPLDLNQFSRGLGRMDGRVAIQHRRSPRMSRLYRNMAAIGGPGGRFFRIVFPYETGTGSCRLGFNPTSPCTCSRFVEHYRQGPTWQCWVLTQPTRALVQGKKFIEACNA